MLRRSSIPRGKSSLKRGKPICRKGPRATLWENFAEQEAVKDRDEEGLIKCEDYKIGLPRCGVAVPRPDLHHVLGRDGNLLLDKKHLVWLVRPCHELAHNPPSSTSPKTENDSTGQVGQAPSSSQVSPVQGRSSIGGPRKPGRTIYSSVQSRHAPVMEQKREGTA